MYIGTTLALAIGFTVITAMAVHPYVPTESWGRLFASVMPLALVVSAVLALLAS